MSAGLTPDSRQPRVLYVVPCWLHERAFGGQIRALHIARSLAQRASVSLAVIGADAVPADVKRLSRAEFDVVGEWPLEPTGVRGLRSLAKSIADPDFVTVHGIALSVADERAIETVFHRDFDIIWFFQLRTANFFRRARWSGAVVDVDNLLSARSDAGTQESAAPFAGLRRRLRHYALQAHEGRVLERFGTIAVCSAADRQYLGGGSRIHIIPNGFERPAAPIERRPTSPPRLGFIGLLDYEPNIEGVTWFIENCWPAIRREVPDVRLRIAGRGGHRVPANEAQGIDVLGWVEDAQGEVATWSVFLVPIRSGGGTRVKLADAFSRRCPVVSTHLGAYGYDVEEGVHCRLADAAADFTRACVETLRDPGAAESMAARAWQRYLQRWSWDAIRPAVWDTLGAALEK